MTLKRDWLKKCRRVGNLALFAISFAFSGEPAIAQSRIVPDTSLGNESSQVDNGEVDGNTAEIIEGGAQRGANLFHSFDEFSVEDGEGAYFSNPTGIETIFGRVTGANPSEIFGTLGVSGNADLFLINPQGIIFGENARLDLNGSFVGSSANSINFADGTQFGTTELEGGTLLTVNVPVGLQYGNSGSIVNRSTWQNDLGEVVGLEVEPGNNITLLGGDLNFEGGNVTAKGGSINLGGLSAAGTITLDENGGINPQAIRADINLSNGADVDARGDRGRIDLDAGNLTLQGGEASSIRAGIATTMGTQAGNISIDAGNIRIDQSSILNSVEAGATGNAGDINITANNLNLTNGGGISASTAGQGDAGNITVDAAGDLVFDGENSQGLPSGIGNLVSINAAGDAGNISVTAANLTLTNGGQVSASTLGLGDAGQVNVSIAGDITLDGMTSDTLGIRSSINSGVNVGAVGNAGESIYHLLI